MTETKTKKRKMNLSPEERLRRSEQAKKQVAEGKIGGKQKGAGRPKTKRAQEHVAEKIRDDAEAIYKALKAALQAESDQTKLKAALAMLDIETKESDHKMKEEQRAYDNMDRENLTRLIKEKLAQLEQAGITFDPDRIASELERRGNEDSSSPTRQAIEQGTV
jgi:thioredoxin-like negative regulator of GroEL